MTGLRSAFRRILRKPQPVDGEPAGDSSEGAVDGFDVETLLADKVRMRETVDGLLCFNIGEYVEGRDPWPAG